MALDGKVAIVTGASAGIGRAYALALAGAGATVIAAARRLGRGGDIDDPVPHTLAGVVRAGANLPGRIYAHTCDVEVEADIVRVMDETIANFGRIDVLVNNAGIYPHYESLDVTVDEWEKSMRVNARGAFLTIKHVAPHMKRQRSGSIINMTSLVAAGSTADHPGHSGLLLYAVSKAALNRLTTHVAEDLKEYGITVSALSPGIVLTDTLVETDPSMVSMPVTKTPSPEEMGAPLLYLADQPDPACIGRVLHHDEFGKSWP